MVNFKYSNILDNMLEVNAIFSNKWNILLDISGTGKSFLLKLIYSDYTASKSILGNDAFLGLDNQRIFDNCRDKQVILLDNADLYINNDLIAMLDTLDAVFIVSLKHTYDLIFPKDMNYYRVNLGDNKLVTERFNSNE